MIAGVTQAAAEEYYITMVMQLEGYGHETFSAKVYKAFKHTIIQLKKNLILKY
jgi:hypothetical protein